MARHINEKQQTVRRCNCEFKENAVALVRGGRTIASVARGGAAVVAVGSNRVNLLAALSVIWGR